MNNAKRNFFLCSTGVYLLKSTMTLSTNLMSMTVALPTNTQHFITLYEMAVTVAKSKDYCLLMKIVMTVDSGLVSNCIGLPSRQT